MFLLRSDRFPGRARARSSMGSSVQTVLLAVEVGDNSPGVACNLAALPFKDYHLIKPAIFTAPGATT